MRFDFRSAERIRKVAARAALARRPDEELPFLAEAPVRGSGVLLDTCVYIDQTQDRTPRLLEELLKTRVVSHSMVAVQELLHVVGVLDPHDARTEQAIATIRSVLDVMPSHRVFVPDAAMLGEAAVYAGVLCRLRGYAKDDRMRALHDCVLFLQALRLGLTVVTRNVRDFDLLLQLRPDGRVLFYRTS